MRARLFAAAVPLFAACASGEPDLGTNETMSFEEFEAATYKEPWEGGVYIVGGDTPVLDEKALYELWADITGQALIVHQVGGVDQRWDEQTKLQLTYCISDSFGANKPAVIAAMAGATDQGWETMAAVDFVYVSAQDASCTASNENVLFNVSPVSGQPYLARAFFPNYPRAQRNVLIDSTAFNTTWSLTNILAHENGHVLGFRHEHTRLGPAHRCYEDSNWRELTPYDSASVMHYPQCDGTSSDLSFTPVDAQGAANLYGPPGGDPPPPPPTPDGRYTESGTLALHEFRIVPPFTVEPGTRFEATITGTGDADLYVRLGAAPTETEWNCRPYGATANEICRVDVPADQNTVYVGVRGYTAATYNLTVTYFSGRTDEPARMMINEILADPSHFDANGDGVIHTSRDEMLELVNIGGSPADLSGARISDNYGVRAVIPAGTVVGPGEALVVFGGGPAAPIGAGVHIVTAGGTLGLNNDGDTVTLRDPGGAVLATATYGSNGGRDVSLNRATDLDPDAGLVLHTTLDPRRASPGRRVNGSPF